MSTHKRTIATIHYRFLFGIKLPWTAQYTLYSKICDEYEWMENVQTLRALIAEKDQTWHPWYRGVVDLVNVEGD